MAANVRLLITLLTHAGMAAPSCRLSYVLDVAPPVPGAGMRDNGPYVKLVSMTLSNPKSGTSVKLDVPDGWDFLAWLQPVSIGFVGSAYMNPTWRSTAELWIYANNNGSWQLTAILVRPGAIA